MSQSIQCCSLRSGRNRNGNGGRSGFIRLHRGRRGLRRLRAGQPPDRLGPPSRAAARSRRARPASVDSHPARLRQAVRRRAGELALQVGARARTAQPADHPAARQGAGRIELDQRPALSARPARRLRPLAAARQHRLELRRRAALLPPLGGPGARRGRAARHRRAARRLQRVRAASAVRGLHRIGAAGRLSAQRRLQRADPGGRRLFPAHREERPPLVDRGRLSEGGAAAAQSQDRDQRAGQPHPVRGPARDRHRIPARRHDAHRACEPRGDPRGRRIQLAATAAAFGRRSRVAAALARHRRDRRHGRCRRRPAGPSSGPHAVPLHRADHHERRDQQLPPTDDRRRALRDVPQGPAGDRRGLCRRLLPHQPAGRDAGHAGALHHLQRRHGGRGAASVPGLHRVDLPAAAGEPRLRPHQVGRSGAGAGDPAALSDEPARPRHGGRLAEDAPQDHGTGGDAALHRRRARARTLGSNRCRASRFRAFGRNDGVPPDQHLPHGSGRHRGGRRAAARARDRGLARGRCLDHADRRVRQHQCAGGDDRGKGRGHDPAGRGRGVDAEGR